MTTERDTHFLGFAKLLVPKILQEVAPYTDGASLYCDECVAYLHPDLERLIAQRAYDLVYQSIEFMRQAPQNWPSMELSGTETWVHFIPDLTTPPPAAPGSAAE